MGTGGHSFSFAIPIYIRVHLHAHTYICSQDVVFRTSGKGKIIGVHCTCIPLQEKLIRKRFDQIQQHTLPSHIDFQIRLELGYYPSKGERERAGANTRHEGAAGCDLIQISLVKRLGVAASGALCDVEVGEIYRVWLVCSRTTACFFIYLIWMVKFGWRSSGNL